MKNSKGDPTELKLIRQNNENKIKNFKYAIFGFRIFCGLVQETFQIKKIFPKFSQKQNVLFYGPHNYKSISRIK